MKFLSVFLFSSILLAQPPQRLVYVTTDPSGACSSGAALQWNPTSGNLFGCSSSTWGVIATTSSGGTVTSFSAGTLSPLFTTSVATASTTPALSFTLSNFTADSILGNFTALSATPSTQVIPSCANDGSHALVYASHTLTCETITGGGFTPDNVTLQTISGTSSAITSYMLTRQVGAQGIDNTIVDSGSSTASAAVGAPIGNAITYSLSVGMTIRYTPAVSCTGGVAWTLNVNGTALPVKNPDGSDPSASQCASGTPMLLQANAASPVTAWLIMAPQNVTGSPWVITGSNIYYNTGNVGIGTTSPAMTLQVGGQINANIPNDYHLTVNQQAFISTAPNGGYGGGFAFNDTNYAGVFDYGSGTHFVVYTGAASGTTVDSLRINPNRFDFYSGGLGIGVIPAARLDVSGDGTSPTVHIMDQTASTGVTKMTLQDGVAQSSIPSLRVVNNAGTAFSVTARGGVGSGIIMTDSAGACWQIVPTVTTGVLTSSSVTCPTVP